MKLLHFGSRMAMMSVISYGVNIGLFALFAKIVGLPPELSAVVTVIVIMVINFSACKYWIFEVRNGSIRQQFARFAVLTLVFRGAELGMFFLIYRLTNLDELLVYPMVLAISFFAKIFFFGRAVFGKI